MPVKRKNTASTKRRTAPKRKRERYYPFDKVAREFGLHDLADRYIRRLQK